MVKVPIDNYAGCLLGGAVGDALGAPVEFMSLNAIRSKYGKNGVTDFVEFPGNAGEFTDDTQMTLFTAEGLLLAESLVAPDKKREAVIDAAYQSYLRWLRTQDTDPVKENIKHQCDDQETGWLIRQKELYKRRAPGITCQNALRSGKAGTVSDPVNNSKGCGTVMRMAPAGLMYYRDRELAFQTGCDLSAITHGNPTGYLSGGFFAALISDLAKGLELQSAIVNSTAILKKWKGHGETLEAVEKALELYEMRKHSAQEIQPETIEQLGGSWTAEEALSVSLYASLLFTDNYEQGVLFSINHSGDSDSTGSLTGNILGLIHGRSAIPVRWTERLRYGEIVVQMAEKIYALAI